MLQLNAAVDTGDSNSGQRINQDIGAEDVVVRGKELLQQKIRQAEATNSGEVSWGRLVVLVAFVLAMIAFASVLGR